MSAHSRSQLLWAAEERKGWFRLEIKKRSPSPPRYQSDPLLDLWLSKHLNSKIIKNTHSNNWKRCLTRMYFTDFFSLGLILEFMELSSEAAGTPKGIYRTNQVCSWEDENCQQQKQIHWVWKHFPSCQHCLGKLLVYIITGSCLL